MVDQVDTVSYICLLFSSFSQIFLLLASSSLSAYFLSTFKVKMSHRVVDFISHTPKIYLFFSLLILVSKPVRIHLFTLFCFCFFFILFAFPFTTMREISLRPLQFFIKIDDNAKLFFFFHCLCFLTYPLIYPYMLSFIFR